jgi:hypothetical protein
MSLGALGGLGGGPGGGASGGASSGAPTAEVTAEQIEEIRRLVAYNPILTGPLLEQIKGEDRELYDYIANDPEKLLHALSRGGDDSGGPSVSTPPTSLVAPPALPPAAARLPTPAPVPAPMPPRPSTESQTSTISVTREEHEQIEGVRLLFISCYGCLLTPFVHRLWEWVLRDRMCFRRFSRATGMQTGRSNFFLRVHSNKCSLLFCFVLLCRYTQRNWSCGMEGIQWSFHLCILNY